LNEDLNRLKDGYHNEEDIGTDLNMVPDVAFDLNDDDDGDDDLENMFNFDSNEMIN
jgi:hypothetical protein